MLRLYDRNRDITNDSQTWGNPACLGEPWCSAWGICKALQEPEQAASMEKASGSGSSQEEEYIEHLILEPASKLKPAPPLYIPAFNNYSTN